MAVRVLKKESKRINEDYDILKKFNSDCNKIRMMIADLEMPMDEDVVDNTRDQLYEILGIIKDQIKELDSLA